MRVIQIAESGEIVKILPVANFAPLLLSLPSPFVAGSDEDEAGDVLVKSEKIPSCSNIRLYYKRHRVVNEPTITLFVSSPKIIFSLIFAYASVQ